MDSVKARAAGAPARPSRSMANDERILRASLAIAARDGWLGLSPNRVASESGLSRTAVKSRFDDDVEIAVGVWQQLAAGAIAVALGSILSAAGLLDGAGDADRLARAMTHLVSRDEHLRAGSELLVIAHFQPSLADSIDTSLGATVRGWLDRRQTELAARRAFVLCLALGLMLTSRRKGAGRLDWGPLAGRLLEGLHTETPPVALPRIRARHLGEDLAFGTGDPTHDALLRATLYTVAEHGFDGATTRAIAKATGCSEGFLFARYPSKLALFLDVTKRQQALAFRSNEAFIEDVAKRSGQGVAEAITLREFQHPDRARDRALTLEQWRLGWHEPSLGTAQEKELASIVEAVEAANPDRLHGDRVQIHYSHALGLGSYLLPLLDPDCWRLPYDRATIPLVALGL